MSYSERMYTHELREEHADRSRRLSQNVKTLYHQTSPEFAQKILSSKEMRCGSGGLAGGGIYFAISPNDTEHKAHAHGVILQCSVLLGRVKLIDEKGDRSTTHHSLLVDGYDSVKIPRQGGVEFVVYKSDQVRDIKKLREFGVGLPPLQPQFFTGGMQQWRQESQQALLQGKFPGPPPAYRGSSTSSCAQCGRPWNGPHSPGCGSGMLNAMMFQSTFGGSNNPSSGCAVT